MNVALIGGTGLDEMAGFRRREPIEVSTRYGTAEVLSVEMDGQQMLFVPRHGLAHDIPPAQVNYRAQMAALKKLGVDRVLAVCAVGSLSKELAPGSFAVLGDFIDLTKHRADTFFDTPGEPVVHTDFTVPYCPEASSALAVACAHEGISFEADAVYVGVEGPRYESPAEIRLYSSWGAHVIGMTNVPEVVLAREAGLCYGALAMVTNFATGICPTPLSHEEVRAAVASVGVQLRDILGHAVKSLPSTPSCACGLNTGLVV